MSFSDRVVLWLHVAFALFTIGPLAVATMSTPRYVRARNLPVLRYLARMTRIFTVISLGVLIFGIVLAQMRDDFSRPWLSVSMTLFAVSLVLLVLVIRDQHRAIVALDAAATAEVAAPAGGPAAQALEPAAPGAAPPPPGGGQAPDSGPAAAPDAAAAAPADTGAAPPPGGREIPHLASVERGRIASLSGLASLIWLVVLALMVWQP